MLVAVHAVQYRAGHFRLEQFDFLNHFLDLVPENAKEAQLQERYHTVAQHEQYVRRVSQPGDDPVGAALRKEMEKVDNCLVHQINTS